jgi:hypothetical protein
LPEPLPVLPPVPGGGVSLALGVGVLTVGVGVVSVVGTLFVSGVGIDVELFGVFAAFEVGLASP